MEEINYHRFYIDKEEKDWLSILDSGLITTNRSIVIKKANSIRPKVIANDKIYLKNILDIYPIFFELGLDTVHNKEVIEYYKKLTKTKYSFPYEINEKEDCDMEREYSKVKTIRSDKNV